MPAFDNVTGSHVLFRDPPLAMMLSCDLPCFTRILNAHGKVIQLQDALLTMLGLELSTVCKPYLETFLGMIQRFMQLVKAAAKVC